MSQLRPPPGYGHPHIAPPHHLQPHHPTPPQARRGPGPMLANTQQPAHQQMTQVSLQHQQMLQERELAKRRARKPTDKTIPESVEEVVSNVRMYRELRDMERRYDAAVMRKRLDLQDAANRNVKNQKTMRIYISNTAKDQPWQVSDRPLEENAFDFDTGQIPTFRVKIEGRLLDDEGDVAEQNPDSYLGLPPSSNSPAEKTPAPKKRFSHFFKTIIVELDRSLDLHPEGNTIEWRKQAPNTQPATGALGMAGPAEFDGFEFERKGDENINCTIKLVRDESPDRFRVAPALADLLDTTEDTRAGIVMKMWEYIRAHGLQDPEERRQINCNAALKSIFNADRLYFPTIPEITLSYILPLEPIVIPYTIRCDVPAHMSPIVRDITVYTDDPIRQKMSAIIHSPAYTQMLREITTIDEHIALLVQAINHSKAKRDFYKAMSEDPANFIKRWVSSQKRDFDTVCGEAAAGMVEDEEKRNAMWKERVMEHAYLLLDKRGVGGP